MRQKMVYTILSAVVEHAIHGVMDYANSTGMPLLMLLVNAACWPDWSNSQQSKQRTNVINYDESWKMKSQFIIINCTHLHAIHNLMYNFFTCRYDQ